MGSVSQGLPAPGSPNSWGGDLGNKSLKLSEHSIFTYEMGITILSSQGIGRDERQTLGKHLAASLARKDQPVGWGAAAIGTVVADE